MSVLREKEILPKRKIYRGETLKFDVIPKIGKEVYDKTNIGKCEVIIRSRIGDVAHRFSTEPTEGEKKLQDTEDGWLLVLEDKDTSFMVGDYLFEVKLTIEGNVIIGVSREIEFNNDIIGIDRNGRCRDKRPHS